MSPPQPPSRRFSIVEFIGELLLTAGALLLLFAFYESYWTNIEASREQERVASNLEQRWAGPQEDAGEGQRENPRVRRELALGEAFARMYIPSFGPDFHFAIVEGTEDADLLAGPGRYTDTQMPGQPGNFAVAGHRVGKGAPFNDLGNLRTCDPVVVETRDSWDIYRVLPVDATTGEQRRAAAAECLTPEQVERVAVGDYAGVDGRLITVPGDVSVIDPVPGLPGVVADPHLEGLMTMTTCHPRFSNAQRMIVHAMLVRTDTKRDGFRPAELEEN
ncbi:class E sortase [Corynebacterium pygosceleis]|uniref:Class E sortase n=1 Tax=Corynebacterium pygosceleis TaxID=2800406 RepID=A0A9Q4CBX9_9CORY|nr:class E sortase [Corynebacterium pygosceleis]MCK7638203.1 class E sortase [Corynebacterium pygosceleis]MCL0121565.1 class E sortase [Corynebacterium pygosceleis]MCX7445762.1 class E sortase [Corynebacterium pygosceleis]MCX7469358.1 class E sortase [Corynebacterium pygosceleis]